MRGCEAKHFDPRAADHFTPVFKAEWFGTWVFFGFWGLRVKGLGGFGLRV